ncbi:hypothetical protein JHK85_010795 [Glycine max]|nr:hypothetical protein JHK85_010795 [Glycine max]
MHDSESQGSCSKRDETVYQREKRNETVNVNVKIVLHLVYPAFIRILNLRHESRGFREWMIKIFERWMVGSARPHRFQVLAPWWDPAADYCPNQCAGIRVLINDPLRYGPPFHQPGPSIWRAILSIAALNDWESASVGHHVRAGNLTVGHLPSPVVGPVGVGVVCHVHDAASEVNLLAGINSLALLSVTIGLPNVGEHFESWSTGILGPVALHGLDQGKWDLSGQKWSYQDGLKREAMDVASPNGISSVAWMQSAIVVQRNQPLTWHKVAMRKLEKVQKKANAISDRTEIFDRSKRKQIEQLYKRVVPKRPKKEYVVAKKGVQVRAGKGKVIVDRRMKKNALLYLKKKVKEGK